MIQVGRRLIRVKLILQKSGIEIKPRKYQGRKQAGLKEYIFPHNRLVYLIVYYRNIVNSFGFNYNQIAIGAILLTKSVSLFSIPLKLNYP
jgi:hypothetical protein